MQCESRPTTTKEKFVLTKEQQDGIQVGSLIRYKGKRCEVENADRSMGLNLRVCLPDEYPPLSYKGLSLSDRCLSMTNSDLLANRLRGVSYRSEL